MVDLPQRGRVAFVGDAAHLHEQVTADVPRAERLERRGEAPVVPTAAALQRSGIDTFLSHDVDDFAALPSGGSYWD